MIEKLRMCCIGYKKGCRSAPFLGSKTLNFSVFDRYAVGLCRIVTGQREERMNPAWLQALYPGAASPLTVTNRLLSPRRTWSVRVVLRSSCASSLLNCSADLTSVVWPLLVTAVITSPERTSARRLLRTSSTITPPLNFRSRFCSALFGGTAFLDGIDERPRGSRKAERLGKLFGDFLDHDADPSAVHPAELAQLALHIHRNIDRDRERKPHKSPGAAVDLRIDAHDFAPHVEQRPA